MKKLAVLLLAVTLCGCTDNYGACEKASLNIGNGIASGMVAVDQLRVAGKVSIQEETNVLGFLKFANDGNGVFAACAQQVHASGAKTGYTSCATTLQQTLANPQELALIHVNDATSQQNVLVIVNGLNTGISSLIAALGGN
jgi:hypothetical protein